MVEIEAQGKWARGNDFKEIVALVSVAKGHLNDKHEE